MSLSRSDVLPEEDLPRSDRLLAEGRALARDWSIGPCPFLTHYDTDSEWSFKRRAMAEGRIMQHAQIGYRDPAKSGEAYASVYDACASHGVTVHRYGICLDWSMGYRRTDRDGKLQGTGLILDHPEDFARLTARAPVAPHFGDFVLGFPAAVENTCAALAAGSTSIGNLGQYFTFRLPGHDDDIDATAQTVRALGLIAAQDRKILVHSNLDDGFAALFVDLASSIGAVLLEQHVVDRLCGAHVSHCFGHHFTQPLHRMAFQKALAAVSETPGTMVYGNTVSYRGTPAANYASLSAYLTADVLAQMHVPTGHAVNPVPVLENERIPDIDEIVDAQLFSGELVRRAQDLEALVDRTSIDKTAERLVAGGRQFRDRVLAGLESAGIDTCDAFETLLALRRIGSRRLERMYGSDRGVPHVSSGLMEEISASAKATIGQADPADLESIRDAGLRILVAATDVHEHGKMLLDETFSGLGIELVDGGVSADPRVVAANARDRNVDAIAISTYNGVARRFLTDLQLHLGNEDRTPPVFMGGRLNQIPDNSNTSLPVDVADELAAAGAVVCRSLEDALPELTKIARSGNRQGKAK